MKSHLSALVVFASSIAMLPAQTGNLTVGRYTIKPAGMVLVENGILRVSTRSYAVFATKNVTAASLETMGVNAGTLAAVNGKFMASKATVDSFNNVNPDLLVNYKFSMETYNLANGPYYIAALAPAATVTIPFANASVTHAKLKEGAKKKSTDFVVTLDKPAAQDVLLAFKTSGSAKSPSDFAPVKSYFLKIPKGKKTAKLKVTVRNDKFKEPKEKLVFTITQGIGYRLGAKTSATLTIQDNDK